jgi:hypothetical protein
MSRQEEEYRLMLEALVTSRTVVVSLLDQLGLNSYKEEQLKSLVRRCAIDLVSRKPVITAALRSDVRQPRGRRTKSKPLVSKRQAVVSGR